jgi:protein TonB
MRNDLYIGALVAVGAHAALALISNPARPVVTRPEPRPTIEVRPFPKIPDEPETLPVAADDAPKGRPDVAAPPSQPDVPRPVTTGDFVQPVRPVYDGPIDRTLSSIPTERPGRTEGREGGVFDPRSLDRAPVARFQARPEYPFEMKRTGSAGEVLVEFVVAADGSVRDARAVRSSQREFEDAAVRAVSKWTFRPGQKDGRNVPTRMQVPIVFSLNDERS